MKLKSTALSGGLLDYFVAIAMKWEGIKLYNGKCWQIKPYTTSYDGGVVQDVTMKAITPTNSSEMLVTAIKTCGLSIEHIGKGFWATHLPVHTEEKVFITIYGTTLEEVVFRAFVYHMLGEELEID